MSDRRWPRLVGRLGASIVLLSVMSCGARAGATSLYAAGDGRHAWLLWPMQEDEAAWALYHRGRSDPADTFRRVGTLAGQVRAASAADGALWLLDRNGDVDVARLVTDEIGPPPTLELHPRPSLPAGTVFRAWDASARTAYALVRVENREVLARLAEISAGGEVAAEPADSGGVNVAIGLPPTLQLNGERADTASVNGADRRAQDGEPSPDDELAGADATVPVDRLLRMGRDGWEPIALPEDWPHLALADVVCTNDRRETLWLIARPSDGSPSELWVFESTAEGWRRRVYDVPGAGPFDAMVVSGQLVVATRRATGAPSIEVRLLRGDRAVPLGELSVRSPLADPRWAVIPRTFGVTLLAQVADYVPDERAWPTDPIPAPLRTVSVNLQGRTMSDQAAPVRLIEPAWWDHAAQQLIMLVLLMLTIAMVFVFWRRDPRSVRVELPESLALAELGRRGAAGVIDLTPAVAVAMAAFDVSLMDLARHWPGAEVGEPAAMLPGATVIGVFVLHTTASELFTQRTLGKAMMGLTVTDLRGQRPTPGRVIVRGLLKALDLVAWLLLILPLLGVYRQRLGDVIAQTIVVMPAPPDQQHESEDEDQ